MTKLVFRFATLGTFMTILVAAPTYTPAYAMGGSVGGFGGYPDSLMRLDPPEQPSPQVKPARVKSTHKTKKITKHSSMRQPGT